MNNIAIITRKVKERGTSESNGDSIYGSKDKIFGS
jgi:hypothetical protein